MVDSKLYFYKINILFFTILAVQSSVSELRAVRIFKLRGQKANHDGHTDIIIDIYSCNVMNQRFYILQNFLYGPLFLRYTECPNIYQKSVLHLLKYKFAVYLSRCCGYWL